MVEFWVYLLLRLVTNLLYKNKKRGIYTALFVFNGIALFL